MASLTIHRRASGDAVRVLQLVDVFQAQEPGDGIPCGQAAGRDHPPIPSLLRGVLQGMVNGLEVTMSIWSEDTEASPENMRNVVRSGHLSAFHQTSTLMNRGSSRVDETFLIEMAI